MQKQLIMLMAYLAELGRTIYKSLKLKNVGDKAVS